MRRIAAHEASRDRRGRGGQTRGAGAGWQAKGAETRGGRGGDGHDSRRLKVRLGFARARGQASVRARADAGLPAGTLLPSAVLPAGSLQLPATAARPPPWVERASTSVTKYCK